MRADLVGFSLAVVPNKACYVPLAHRGGAGDLFGGSELLPGQMPLPESLALMKPLLEDAAAVKIGHNIKFDCLVMARHGIRVAPIDDTMLLSYALDGGRWTHGLDELAERHLGHACIPFDKVMEHAPGRKADKNFAMVPIAKAAEYAGEDADMALRLWQVLKPRLAAERVTTVYETLERPLVPVIADMERAGIRVDRAILSLSSTIRAGHHAARGGGLRPRRPQVQPGLAAPARRDSVRAAAAAGRQTHEERPVGDARWAPRRPQPERGPAGRCATAHQHDARMAPAREAALDLHGRAAGLRASGDRAHPHLLLARRDDRDAGSLPPSPTCRTSRSAPRRAARSAPRSSPRPAASSSPPTTARSSSACSPTSPTFRS